MNEATCSCGALRVVARGAPVRVSICHCRACQRRTGSVFGVQARFAREDVELHGEPRTWVRVGDEGFRITFSFCGVCGATVWYQIAGMEEHVAVPVGAFADPGFPPPTVSVYEERMHGWVSTPGDIERWP